VNIVSIQVLLLIHLIPNYPKLPANPLQEVSSKIKQNVNNANKRRKKKKKKLIETKWINWELITPEDQAEKIIKGNIKKRRCLESLDLD